MYITYHYMKSLKYGRLKHLADLVVFVSEKSHGQKNTDL